MMKKLQRATALISILPITLEKKFTYLNNLIAVVHNEKLLDFAINNLVREVTKELSFSKVYKKKGDEEKLKMEEIRAKLASLSKFTAGK